jgi:curli biogenesis system outer membrane secretion channel CsgG
MTTNRLRNLTTCLLTALILCAGSSSADPARGNLRYSVVVAKFENKTDSQRALGDEWATLLTTQLYESGHFIVVSQTETQLQALKEQLRVGSGITAQGKKSAVRGQMTPAQLLVEGVITDFKESAADQGGGVGIGKFRVNAGRKKTEIRATIQIVDTTTGAIVAARNFVGTAQARAFSLAQTDRGNNVSMGQDDNVHAAFEKAISDAIPWMVLQLPSVRWRGSVVKVEKDRIIVNRGSREGVSAGDEFIVGESEMLRDPDTGEVLDEIVHERARIKVIQVNERTAVCSVVSGTVQQIVERMGILYSNES